MPHALAPTTIAPSLLSSSVWIYCLDVPVQVSRVFREVNFRVFAQRKSCKKRPLGERRDGPGWKKEREEEVEGDDKRFGERVRYFKVQQRTSANNVVCPSTLLRPPQHVAVYVSQRVPFINNLRPGKHIAVRLDGWWSFAEVTRLWIVMDRLLKHPGGAARRANDCRCVVRAYELFIGRFDIHCRDGFSIFILECRHPKDHDVIEVKKIEKGRKRQKRIDILYPSQPFLSVLILPKCSIFTRGVEKT